MRRRGFTLIEMVVVCAVLSLIASLVLPSVVSMKSNRDREEAYDAVLRLAQQGHVTAIQSGRAYVLTVDGTSVSLDRAEQAEMSRDGQGTSGTVGTDMTQSVRLPESLTMGGSSGNTRTDGSLASGSETDGASVSLPPGTSVGDATLGGKASTSSDFTLHFYPDGHSEGGGFEISDGLAVRSLIIDRNGLATLAEGKLPAAAENSWEAGQYEQRASS